MVKEYEFNNIINNKIDNPFCSKIAPGIFGMLARIERDTRKLENKISRNTYIWIEKLNDDF